MHMHLQQKREEILATVPGIKASGTKHKRRIQHPRKRLQIPNLGNPRKVIWYVLIARLRNTISKFLIISGTPNKLII